MRNTSVLEDRRRMGGAGGGRKEIPECLKTHWGAIDTLSVVIKKDAVTAVYIGQSLWNLYFKYVQFMTGQLYFKLQMKK